MKKKLLAIALCVCTAFSFTACGEEKEETPKVTLGEYKGLKVDATLGETTEDEIQAYLDSVLQSYSETIEVTEGALEAEETAKLSYTATIDGAEYKSAEGDSVELTDTGFNVDGFVDGLIGHSVGETVELDLVLPEDFTDTEVAGKDVHFTVTIEAKLVTEIPEFTDEFVAKNLDYLGLATKQDLLDYLENDIILGQVYEEVWSDVIDGALVEEYDEEEVSELAEQYAEQEEYYIYTYTGYDLASYLELVGMTEEEFDEQMKEVAKSYIKQQMVIKAIADAEGIEMTDELYENKMLEMAKTYGYDTTEEFEEAYADSVTKEDFENTILAYMVQEIVCENVEYVEGYGLRSEQETSGEDTSSEDTSGEEATDDTNENAVEPSSDESAE